MATTFNHTITAEKVSGVSPIAKFFSWASGQEEERLLWLGLGLGLHGCVVTPLAFMVVVMSGINMFALAMVMISIVSVLVVNLAALPTKVTVPVFFLSVVVDILVIAACAATGFNLY